MKIRRGLTLGVAALAFALAGCSTGSDDNKSSDDGTKSSAANASAGDIRIDVITHANAGDSFWEVVKAGAVQAGKDEGVDLHYQSDGDVGKQATLIDNAVAAGTDGLVISMANPDGLEESIKAAIAAGIPVITINSGIDKWKEFGAITHVGQSETIAGEEAGRQLKEAGATNAICVIHEAGNIGLEDRCKAAADAFGGTMKNLQVDSTDLAGAQATIESQLSADSGVDAILTLNGDLAGRAVAAVGSSGRDVMIGTFDLNADVAGLIKDGSLLFAIDQQPYVQGYLGVTGIYLKLINGNDIGGGQPVYSGPAVVTKVYADVVLTYARIGTG